MVLKSAGEYAVIQEYVGYCYNNGIGTDKDNDKAIYWYRKDLNNGAKDRNILISILLGS